MLSLTIDQQGERLLNYRSDNEEEKFEPARFNIMLIYQPVSGPLEFIACEEGAWFHTSLILHM